VATPAYLLPLAAVLLLVVFDRPCPGCGRIFRHRLDCRYRAL
jgi:hypothetical protein